MKLSDVGNNKEYNKVKNSIKEIFNTDKYCLIWTKEIAIAFQKWKYYIFEILFLIFTKNLNIWNAIFNEDLKIGNILLKI